MAHDDPRTPDPQEAWLREIEHDAEAAKRGRLDPGGRRARPTTSSPSPASPSARTLLSQFVVDREHARIGQAPQVGLAISGGGIRSATFALGLVQALFRLRVFSQIDYVSTVSGGGYTGGWLYALQRRGQLEQALSLAGEEPRQVRFLRAFSNYLTPKLGLFSGDTWAVVATVVRNLTLTFTILSISLLALLMLPWVVGLEFRSLLLAANGSPAVATGLLALAAALLALAFAISANNMSRPLKDGGWAADPGAWTKAWQAQLLVVGPILLAMFLVAAVVGRVPPPPFLTYALPASVSSVWVHSANAAVSYGVVWAVALAVAYAWKSIRRRTTVSSSGAEEGKGDGSADGAQDAGSARATEWRAALKAWLVLTVSASLAGAVGGLVVVSVHTTWFNGDPRWPDALLMVPVTVLGFLVATTVHLGLAGAQLSDETREWWARVGGYVTLAALMLTTLSVIALWLPVALRALAQSSGDWLGAHPDILKALLVGVWGMLTGAGVAAGRSSQTSDGRGAPLLELAGRLAPVTFIVGYLTILSSWVQDAIVVADQRNVLSFALALEPTRLTPMWAAIGGLALAAVALVLSWRVDLNEFSLHAFYRNRLVRCYLGASNDRHAHPFTGFDVRDDLSLAPELDGGREAAARSDAGVDAPLKPIRPYPLFNTAINLVGGENLAWQQRKAASFVFTPDYCGYEYRIDEQRDRPRAQNAPSTITPAAMPAASAASSPGRYCATREHAGYPLTVGLAMATSGAAASPNMGYHTSPTLAFLMTVFNVRLGWWLRNSRFAGVWRDHTQRLSLRELVYELLGMTTDDQDLVYLSDGGHFENLGLYELVRRQCPFIITSDAGQDGQMSFEDLGNAIEKCRADFGIDIEIDVSKIRLDGGRSHAHCAIGTIHYEQFDPSLTPGTLLYLKSSLTGDEPTDVLRYASLHAEFPHQTTADQFFSESQFESYRALGYHVGREVFRGVVDRDAAELSPAELVLRLRQRWSTPAPSPSDAVAKYSGALNAIWATVRTDPRLRFLDGQMFPEWASLMASGGALGHVDVLPAALTHAVADDAPRTHEVTHWLPQHEDNRRAGFYICTEMLQLMEDVFLEFHLDEHSDHIDNRGWMNLFQHWAWSGMLSATWAVTASTYDPRFQRFCRDKLDLRPGRVGVSMDDVVALPGRADWHAPIEPQRLDQLRLEQQRAWQEAPASLNFLEAELVGVLLGALPESTDLRLYPIRIVVGSPRPRDPQRFEFTAGYVVLREQPGERPVLIHMRVQNHLRKMGVGREALRSIVTNTSKPHWAGLQVAIPSTDPATQGSAALDEALPRVKVARRIEQALRSLRAGSQQSSASKAEETTVKT